MKTSRTSLPRSWKTSLRIATLALVGSMVAVACSNGEADPVDLLELDGGRDGAVTPPEETPDGGEPDRHVSTPTCGNRKLDPGEQCDDGNDVSDDGCSSTCTIESKGPVDVCEGEPVTLTAASGTTLYVGHVEGSTASLYNHYGASCGGGSGADAVYKIESPKVGRAVVRIVADYDAIVSARTACDDVKVEVACGATSPLTLPDGGALDASALPDGGVATAKGEIAFPVYPNAPVFLMVDGYGASKGNFVLDIDVQTAVCGNGAAEAPEECDDGNTTAGDGCSATCTLEAGGNIATCPGKGFRLPAGKMSFAGDSNLLAGAAYTASGCSPKGSGPSAIYALTPTVSGNLSVNLLANFEDAVLFVRRECSDAASQYDCNVGTAALTPLTMSVPVTAEETLYVFVDGEEAKLGLFTLEATLTASACGNGKLDTNEECDDGNTDGGDGCSATCAVERNEASYTCPGQAITLASDAPGPRTARVTGITKPLAGQSLPASKFTSCTSASTACGAKSTCGSTAPDVVYQVTSDIDGMLTATVGGQFNAGISARAACDKASPELVCTRAATGNASKTFKLPVLRNTPYFLIVDGYATANSGTFELAVTVDASVCGNGVIEGGETCDDGAAEDGDGCSKTCQLETDTSRDECATAAMLDLSSLQATIRSGTTNLTRGGTGSHAFPPCSSVGPDGHWPFVAPIDGVASFTITSSNYQAALAARQGCGGSVLACEGESRVAGYQVVFPVAKGAVYDLVVSGVSMPDPIPEFGRFTAEVKIAPSGCGDALVSGDEQCDDGNTQSGDGCSSTCTLESLPGIQSCPGATIAMTGTGNTPRRKVVTVNTAPLQANTSGICGGNGPEGVLAVVSDIDGLLEITSTANYSQLLYARSVCGNANTENRWWGTGSCQSSNAKTTKIPIKAGAPAFVFVDGLQNQSGIAKLNLTVTP